ncbi:ATP-binding cassette domain-containing protein [[Clostridium] hylemonae]|uniref:ABC transporter, ATP-binding protein n=1 Tax=[Clostridium] hylemonae DSM 15053 TaxID=553973 RepID=C0C4E6_9FIRM|nr:ATP-binding cassette domain-containing protein [[Clostridium] hylemonae]EEG72939.1 ABC transporter, ATP-binding protein [[Clostridium] hylemonae DSM 15053]QEK16309.1 putative ABC transporter ATP-binding protein [[Clostridium] hylemonae DSM 15053]
MSIIELRNVSYYYTPGRYILNHVNVSFAAGKMYVITGPSGCGKTTLLSLLGGLDTPKEGAVFYRDSEITGAGLEKHRRNNVSFVFQNYNLIEYMTSIENVRLTAKTDPLPILERLGLSAEESGRNILKLSGGQQQRVAIARALASQSEVILADEPTGNLDQETAVEITEILRESASEYKKCVIIVSHSEEVAHMAEEVYELSEGKLQKRRFC